MLFNTCLACVVIHRWWRAVVANGNTTTIKGNVMISDAHPSEQNRCIITGDLITDENDSKAHIIPSALGGRLKPLGILSEHANGLLEDKFDFPLIVAFQSLMNLLNGSRDRGENQPTPMTDKSGKTYIFRFGEPLALSKPEYEETPTAD